MSACGFKCMVPARALASDTSGPSAVRRRVQISTYEPAGSRNVRSALAASGHSFTKLVY